MTYSTRMQPGLEKTAQAQATGGGAGGKKKSLFALDFERRRKDAAAAAGGGGDVLERRTADTAQSGTGRRLMPSVRSWFAHRTFI